MEKIRREEELTSATAIHCAKVAMLLSSLKNNSTPKIPQFEDDEEKTEMLKIALLKEKQKLKNLKLSTGIILLFPLLILLIFPFLVYFVLN